MKNFSVEVTRRYNMAFALYERRCHVRTQIVFSVVK